MKLKLRVKLILCGLMSILTVAALAFFSESVFAESNSSDSGILDIQISPAYQRFDSLEPGKTYTGKFIVLNGGKNRLDFKVYPTGYAVSGKEYSVSYPETVTSYTTIQKWFTFSTTKGSLEPGAQTEIKYKIEVPKGAVAGGQYAAIMVESVNDDQTTVKANGRIGMLIYSTVNGVIVNCSNVLETEIFGFTSSPTITATSVVENCGNAEVRAKYSMTVQTIFGKEIYSTAKEPEQRTILPETSRYNVVTWSKAPPIGIYKVKFRVDAGEKFNEIEKLVVICPIWFIIMIIAIIGIMIFIVIVRKRKKSESN